MTDTEIILRLEKIFDLLPPSIGDLEDKLEPNERFKDEVYIQHIPSMVEEAQKEFLILCHEIGVLPQRYLEGKVHRQGIVGRFLVHIAISQYCDKADDSGKKEINDGDNVNEQVNHIHDLIYSSWYRFMCIDENYKEWQQPYYAHNYEKYKDSVYSLNDNPHIKQFFRDQKLNKIL